ncbi:MAG: Conserved rane protein of unknown function [Pseudonocardiales bacterium]|nr:Conserved rane protein of unknown function [Pseudonocardiales bacterium]
MCSGAPNGLHGNPILDGVTYPPPPPGWYQDPQDQRWVRWWDGRDWTGQLAPADPAMRTPSGRPVGVDRRPVLDRAVAELKADSVSWGWRPAVFPVGTLIALIVASASLAAVVHPSGYVAKIIFAVVANFTLEAVLVASVWWSGREIAERNGGWGRTFGLRRPRWNDLGYAGVGILVIFVLRIFVVGIANGLTHGRASKEAQNVHVDRVTVVGVILLVAVVVIMAPLVEETLFRGVLLRTFMRRMGFWPAAILSTVIFAGLHVYEVDTLAGALTLAGSVACLGIVNCYLNRLTDRVFPGMLTHAAFNGLAVIVLVVQAGK